MAMSYGVACRCCLLRRPDKDLKTEYSILGKSEVYADMLKDCFGIEIPMDPNNKECGICEVCVTRLRDASDFKELVQECQKEFLSKLMDVAVEDESGTTVKEEPIDIDDDNDNDDGMYFIELTDGMSDREFNDDDDNKKLAEILGLNDVTIKKQSSKRRTKRMLLDSPGKELKSNSRARNISLRALPKVRVMKKIVKPVKRKEGSVKECIKYRANIDTLLKHSNCTPFYNKTLTGIQCVYCKTKYRDLPDLRTHTYKEHSTDNITDSTRMDRHSICFKMDITDLKCTICNTNADTISLLKKHLIKDHNIHFYTDVKDYILEFKLTNGDIFNCALCPSKYETFKMLLQHMNGHYRNYICEVCDYGFLNKHKLKNHQRIHDIGDYSCQYCDKMFSTKIRKLCHEKYTHNSGARYTTNCPHCEESFTSYYKRNTHMASQHNVSAATYKCNVCDKNFILKSKLTNHIKKVHLMERNYICAQCGQGFFIKQALEDHMIKHNGEKVFKCMVCSKSYARKKTLREHMRIHDDDRRFKCGICAVAFVQKCSLKNHMMSHHGISLAAYECTRLDTHSP